MDWFALICDSTTTWLWIESQWNSLLIYVKCERGISEEIIKQILYALKQTKDNSIKSNSNSQLQ